MQSEKIAGEAAMEYCRGFSCLCEGSGTCGKCETIAELTPIIHQAITSATAELSKEVKELTDLAHKHGWNGVENSKILHCFFSNLIDALQQKLSAAEAVNGEMRDLLDRAGYWLTVYKADLNNNNQPLCLNRVDGLLSDIDKALSSHAGKEQR